MRKTLSLLWLVALSVAPAATTNAQTNQSLAAADTRPTQVTVTFMFQSPTVDYSLYASEGGEQRYYIRVPTSNIPSYKVTPAGATVQVMVDNDKSSNEFITFWIPMRVGAPPRVDRTQSGLALTFTPADGLTEPSGPDGAPGSAPAVTVFPTSGASSHSAMPSPQATPTPAANPLLPLLPPFETDKKLLSFADADLAVPESPAFTVLDLTPETVVRPSTPREFVSSLLSGVDRHGNFQSGVALDTAPYLTLAGDQLTLGQYRASKKLRFLARTQLSFATTKGASEEDKSARLSLGLRLTLFDHGDPHSDQELMDCFTRVGNTLFSIPPPNLLPPDMLPPSATQQEKAESAAAWQDYNLKKDAFDAKKNEGHEQCRTESRKRNWNKSSWIVAFAPSWISTTGQTKEFKWNGGGFWTSVSYGFEGIPSLQKHSQLIFHARYRNNEQMPDPDNKGKFFGQDSFFLGSRLRVGTEDSTASFEGVFNRSRHKGQHFDNSARYSVGLERKIAENLWFALAFGGESGRQDQKNNGFVLTSFRWGFSQKRTIGSSSGR